MERRNFAKLLGLGAVAVSASGFIRNNGSAYVGDCETTSDILGPFYRPGSPVRTDLVIPEIKGKRVKLSGVVRRKDCVTPFKGARIELWHCSADGVYDNETDEFRYRGTTLCDDQGKYSFTTQLPVPYDVGNGDIRPAHFHLMVSARGYQSLITQIYFTGDPHLKEDAYAADSRASSRILPVEEKTGQASVTFDVNMNERLLASPKALSQIVGQYRTKDGKEMELFAHEGRLWKKNEVFGQKFDYISENLFEYSGLPAGMKWSLKVGFDASGAMRITESSVWENGKETVVHYQRI